MNQSRVAQMADTAQPLKLSIVIVNWNVADLVEQCLASIAETAGDLAHEVILVDNASTDYCVARVERGFVRIGQGCRHWFD